MSKNLTYSDAGVNIEAGNALVEKIKPLAKSSIRPGVVDAIGGFGALFDLKKTGLIDPILVAATDGVGTKLKLAIETNNCSTIGIDLVAMCVNDLICQGAEPLFFLDYFATGNLDLKVALEVIKGIARGCKDSGCALIGGETAEMPGIYKSGDFDLAGFALGAVERNSILPSNVCEGDVLLGLASNGIHSNGFSLVRKIIELAKLDLNLPCSFSDLSLGAELLKPTKLYVDCTRVILNKVNSIAHITGGGLIENIPRGVPEGLTALIDLDSWELPKVFKWLYETGRLSETEMLRTFNCGIGLVLAVNKNNEAEVVRSLKDKGETVIPLGKIVAGRKMNFIGQLF